MELIFWILGVIIVASLVSLPLFTRKGREFYSEIFIWLVIFFP